MRTEVYQYGPDTKAVTRGSKEVLVEAVYGYNLLATNPIEGYKVRDFNGKTLHFTKKQTDAVKWAKEHVRG